MNFLWLILAVIVWLLSAICIIVTIYELAAGKTHTGTLNFWGGVVFHGGTAILALWLLLKGLGKA